MNRVVVVLSLFSLMISISCSPEGAISSTPRSTQLAPATAAPSPVPTATAAVSPTSPPTATPQPTAVPVATAAPAVVVVPTPTAALPATAAPTAEAQVTPAVLASVPGWSVPPVFWYLVGTGGAIGIVLLVLSVRDLRGRRAA